MLLLFLFIEYVSVIDISGHRVFKSGDLLTFILFPLYQTAASSL